ncbi:helix-turn-helix domain-containing protein [Paenibacillus chungangensis]|uniref:Helix-turn-helix domain-containing protein n=1 Tax=Paenibacillus chungangensis TaxID=696535 RepID=A0ABW3HKF2_9BACL
MRKARGNHVKVLLYYFIPFALLLALFGGAGLFIYEKTVQKVESSAQSTAQYMLEQMQENVERRFVEVETIAMQVASNTKVLSFLQVKDPFRDSNPYRIIDVKNDLFDYSLVNQFLIDYYVIYPESELAISPKSVSKLRQLYDLKFQYEGVSYEEWRGMLLSNDRSKQYVPGRPSLYQGKSSSVVTFLQPFGTGAQNGQVLMLIDNTQIQSMLSNLTLSGGVAFIANKQGELISAVGDGPFSFSLSSMKDGYYHMKVGEENMYVTRISSSYSGWTYVALQPEKKLMERAEYIRQTFLTVLAIALLGGLLTAFYFSYRNSQWLWKMLRLLPEQRGVPANTASVRHTIDYVGQSVTSLIFNHETLVAKLDEQLPLLRSAFLGRLLRGQFPSGRDIALAMEHSKLSWEGRYIMVAILQLASYKGAYTEEILDELNIQKLGIRELIAKEYAGMVTTLDLDEHQIALFFHGDASSQKRFQEKTRLLLEELQRGINEKLGVLTYIAAGGSCSQLTDVSRSYQEASFLLDRKEWSTEQPVACHGDMGTIAIQAYFYPSDLEQRLMGLVKSGNDQEVKDVLAQLTEKNVRERSLPHSVGKIFIHELSGTLLKCCEQSAIPPDELHAEREGALLATEPKRTLEESLDLLGDAFSSLCHKHHDRKKSHNDELKERLIAYVEQNYRRTDLSLTLLAEELQTSETYISYFFKEQTGVNFSEYVERLRMSAARRLLKEGDASVNEIARLVGYYSLNSFSRAFKRANGISATEYRKGK